jgi:multiple RNA-binding domain-containing protein 1
MLLTIRLVCRTEAKRDILFQYFGKCGPLHYLTIATKKDPENPSNKLSMGYGFVRYKRKFDADRALKTLQMTVLDGKTLELKRSERTLMYRNLYPFYCHAYKSS